MDAAEYTMSRAQAMQAMEFAPAEYQSAQTAMADARKAMQETNYSDARESLEFALKHANRAIFLTNDSKLRLAEEEARRIREEEKTSPVILEKSPVVEPAPLPHATSPPKSVVKPAPKPKEAPVAIYSVVEGETLWTISAQPQVYSDGLLWPLLYQANRDQIKNPRQIFPGQTLNIRRDMTQKDLDEARQKARESDIFPVSETVSPN
jgi:nucleoid-associated protein YgaU